MVHFGRCFSGEGRWTPSPIPTVYAFRRTRGWLRVGRTDGRNILRNLPDERNPDSEKSDYGISIRGKSGSLIWCRGFQNLDKIYKFGRYLPDERCTSTIRYIERERLDSHLFTFYSVDGSFNRSMEMDNTSTIPTVMHSYKGLVACRTYIIGRNILRNLQ
ncbi:hypothetical protein CDAR_96531 [Caerostris darwini]|uniref:Uncharacterized protein n=1 Tax=Caerostris darwini TaxID=1538125 RepID=A0AAV4QY23_9ARAC|nr:hypothetical protein CDAR_96531 [Caerostris darwini]